MRFVSLVGLLLIACNPQAPTPIPAPANIIVITSSTNPSSVCATVDRVGINIPTELSVNSSVGIDATPKDNLGQPRSKECDEKSGIVWSYNSDTCAVSDPFSFTTKVLGLRIGTCVLTATVSSVSKTGSFPVK